MTLEQIKNRQEQINGALYTLLNNTIVVVERIVGAQVTNDEKSIEYPTSGLLEEINYSQNTTESYIQKLEEYSRLLYNGTFTPVTEGCTPIK